MKTATKNKGPLAGITVLDLSRVLAGPLCCQHLADLGANVIKVEAPGLGDETRAWGPPFENGVSAYYISCNRGKSGLRLDLKSKAGKLHLRQLVREADVLVENYRPASLKALGLEPSTLRRLNPNLIVGSISGFGRRSPWADQAGYDFMVQGLSGMMAITGPVSGEPSKVGIAIADVLTSLYASTAICAALTRPKSSPKRRKNGAPGQKKQNRGCHIDVSLMDCILASQVNLMQAYFVTGKAPQRYGNAHHQIVPYQVFSAKDGPMIVAVGNDRQFQQLCTALRVAQVARDPRFATNPLRVKNRTSLIRILQDTLEKKSRDTLIEQLTRIGVPAAPILSYDQFASHPFLGWWRSLATSTGVALIPSPFVLDGKRSKRSFDPTLGQS